MRVISVKHSHKLVTYINSFSALWNEMRAHFTAVDLGKKKLSSCIVGCRFPCPKERTPEGAHSICHKRRDKPLKKLNFWTVCMCVYLCLCAERDSNPAKLYSIPSHQRASRTKLHNAVIWQWPNLWMFCMHTQTDTYNYLCAHMMSDTQTKFTNRKHLLVHLLVGKL